jgi:hypothetical protein
LQSSYAHVTANFQSSLRNRPWLVIPAEVETI